MNFEQSLEYLARLGHETLAMKFGLEATELMLLALGKPQEKFLKVQVAGTNGKGSTVVMIDAICRAAGTRTGLYTSPHLTHLTERISVSGQEISKEEFARCASEVRDVATRLVEAGALAAPPTIFEHLTAIALAAFSEAPVELAVLETGLGGRLDATTAARAEIVAITPVALDHQKHLGETLAEIAAEKAAIIRSGVEVIVAPQEPEALSVILKRCAECELTPRMAESKLKFISADEKGRALVSFKTEQDDDTHARLSLPGRHQIINASVAVCVAEALRERGFEISREAISAGLESAKHPGRLEWREGRPAFLFDGAHNEAGARALRAFLDEFVSAPVTLVLGVMRDKDLASMAAVLFPVAENLILTQMDNARSATREMLAELAVQHPESGRRFTLTRDMDEALSAALEQTRPNGVVCVTGSLHLIGEMRERVLRVEEHESDAV